MNTIRVKSGFFSLSGISAVLFSILTMQSGAQSYILAARDTSLQVNLDGSSGGLTDWTIDNVDQLQSQWFYYGIGSSPVAAINTIAPWSTPSITTNLSGSTVTLSETYASVAQSLNTTYALQSSPVGSAKAGLTIGLTFVNNSGTNEVVNLFQYSHFVLGGGTGQFITFPGTSFPYAVNQTNLLSGTYLHGSITSPGNTVGLVAGVYNGTEFGLPSGSPVAFDDSSLSAGTNNVDFGYDFSATLAPNQSITVSELLTVVPEPSSMALFSVGALALAAAFGRRMAGLKKTPQSHCSNDYSKQSFQPNQEFNSETISV